MRVQLIQGLYWFGDLLGSRVQLVQFVKEPSWLKGFISSRVHLVQKLNSFKSSNVNWGNSSNNSRVQFVQGFNLFKGSLGSICSRVQLVKLI